MVRVKRITAKYLCIVSSVVICLSAVFYPFEEFKANEIVSPDYLYSNIVEYTWNHSFTDLYAEDSQFAVRPTQVDLGNYADADQYTYFYWAGASCSIYNMQGKYYAYRIEVEALNIAKDSGSQIFNKVFLISEANDLLDFNGSVAFTTNQVYWYVSEFADAVPLFITPVWILYEYYAEDSTFSYYSGASVDYNATYRFTVVPYSVQDLTDEIYMTLNNIYSTNQSMLTKLEQIYTSVDTVETKMQSLINIAQQIETNTDELEAYVNELEGLLRTCNSYLASIETELEKQTSWLDGIWNLLFEFFNTSDSQQNKVDEFANNSNSQSSNINSLVGDMNAVEKPTVDSNLLDSYIPSNDNFVIRSLRTIMDFPLITQGVLLSVSMAFVAYIFFGKR